MFWDVWNDPIIHFLSDNEIDLLIIFRLYLELGS